MPWNQPLRPSRRSLLAGAAGVAGAALLGGCSEGGGSPEPHTGISLERRLRETAVRDSERLLERYDATTAAHPGLARRLAPLRSAVAAHTAALAFAGPEGGKPSRTPAASPSSSRSGSGSGAGAGSASASATAAGSPAASGEPVPANPAEALSALADAERTLSEARTVALAGAPGELARMLASVAACGAVHAYLLTATQGAKP